MKKIVTFLTYIPALFLLLIVVSSNSNRDETNPVSNVGAASSIDCYIDNKEILNLINEERKSIGLNSLSVSEDLENSSAKKAIDMVQNNYWSHISDDGTEPWDFFADEGYIYKNAGENLARNMCNAKEAFDAWKGSPSHYSNIISDKYKDFGSSTYKNIIVNHFGTRSDRK